MKSVECCRFCYILSQKSGPGGLGRLRRSPEFVDGGSRRSPGGPGNPPRGPRSARGAPKDGPRSPKGCLGELRAAEPPKSESKRPKSRLGRENASTSRKRCSRIHFRLLFLQFCKAESVRHVTSELERRGREARQLRTRRRRVSYCKNRYKTHVGEKARSCAEGPKQAEKALA